MSCYRDVVNDHGSYRGVYSLSDETLNILRSPNFKKNRISFKEMLNSFSLRANSISKEPRCHRFRTWLNKKPILDCLSDSRGLSASKDDHTEVVYQPFQRLAPKNDETVQTNRSFRLTVRQWLHGKNSHEAQMDNFNHSTSELHSTFDTSESTENDFGDCRLKLSDSLTSKLDGLTALG